MQKHVLNPEGVGCWRVEGARQNSEEGIGVS